MAKSNAVIIKRIKKGGHGHHGGAWKVAYADFVTAMMAFFLLLWLLNATTDAQKRGIADYFSPTMATKSTTSGAGGVLGGRVITSDGAKISSLSAPSIDADPAKPPPDEDANDADTNGHAHTPSDADNDGSNFARAGDKEDQGGPSDHVALSKDAQINEAQYQAAKAAHQEQQFRAAAAEIKQAIQNMPDLKPLAHNLVVDRTSEGLRIQLVDQDKTAMFASGATSMSAQAEKLMGLVTQVVAKLPNRIAITGHTDSSQFSGDGAYSNWELSADRANAARRALVAAGMPADRVASVQGKADTDNLIPNDPADPRNRRISIVVLGETAKPAAAGVPANLPPSAVPTPPAPAPANRAALANPAGLSISTPSPDHS